ncbi:NACHT and Ankyrin domain [Micractinium conductrix]|uniref:NACHT and Ankyrin domain n=1 Tax=Micractinium conductrix TaxID=554055 RepID=A0A2P6UZH5_9CHLO|nr:NACHT and Ankyrin domain [Micractinium conductrix]|eukprot:PSC67248.1 NACHT and Ankyrin domain [Micractinium conductrix]
MEVLRSLQGLQLGPPRTGTPTCVGAPAVGPGPDRPSPASETLLLQLVSALIVGDLPAATAALQKARRCRPCDFSRRVHTPFGGSLLWPLQAAVCAPLPPHDVQRLCGVLLELGASPLIAWHDLGGSHTPLSRALAVLNLPLAEALLAHGADPTAALLRSTLLESCRFDPSLVRWLLDRGADVATPLHRGTEAAGCSPASKAAGALACTAGGAGGCAASSRCPPVPTIAVLLSKLAQQLHVSRQLGKLHAGGDRASKEAALLRRAAECCTLLLAAGAAPAGAADPSGAAAAALAGLAPADRAVVQAAATQPPLWSPQSHRLFPRPFRAAAREVLLVARRGFTLPVGSAEAGGSSGSGGGSSGGRERLSHPAKQQQLEQRDVWWLDGGVVNHIIAQLAPSSQL